MFPRDIELDTGGAVVRVFQQETGDEAVVVWDAALVLVKFLDAAAGTLGLAGGGGGSCRVLELGSGTGVLGITAAILG